MEWREKGICLKCKEREGCYLWKKTKDTKIYECDGFIYEHKTDSSNK